MDILEAQLVANDLCQLLNLCCTRVDVAGSIRRKRPDVADIEILVTPNVEQEMDLFGIVIGSRRHKDFINCVNGLGRLLRGKPDVGRYCRIELSGGFCLDLFIPEEHDYYRQLAIRTGSANFAHRGIANAWRKIGWVGTPDGLRRADQCIEKADGWLCTVSNPTLPPVWDSERSFFEWLGLEWKEPEERF